ncbi:GTPase HflX [Simkania negevensis]|uniref:GTPase HflX n=1 Tax=Simkania negevensis TaxID=83561 RepID=A0ABS3APZ1_9BACT|nr:GTPase HflX [Simkania negevensis]
MPETTDEERKTEEQEEVFDKETHRARNAILVGIYNKNTSKEQCKEHLDELELLGETFGVHTASRIVASLRTPDPSTFYGKGKVEEIEKTIATLKCDIVLLDQDISPSQQRNLEQILKHPVMDRTEVILNVFAQRAHTKEAHLQVALARAQYERPRLKRLWTHLSRQRGGGVYLKGEGEKQLEIDKRLIDQRIEKLKSALEEVKLYRETQRHSRLKAEIPTFAIIGYTNAGKSTLLNAIAQADVYTEDKLFATLDTTTRKATLSNKQEVLIIDTVGFIRKLPHQLVAAFKSTLEESLYADILLHVVDAAHPAALEHIDTTMEVLKELGAADKPMITILNKNDLCAEGMGITRLKLKLPRPVQLSALKKSGFDELEQRMIEELSKNRTTLKLRIPQSQYHLVSTLIRKGNVHYQDYEDNDIVMRVEMPNFMLSQVEPYLDKQ